MTITIITLIVGVVLVCVSFLFWTVMISRKRMKSIMKVQKN